MGSASVSPYPLTARPPSPLLVPSPLSIGKDSKWQGDQGLGPYPLFFSILIHFQSLAVNTIYVLLLLLLSRFSCVRLCAAPQTAAHQASPSLGFSRQEHCSQCSNRAGQSFNAIFFLRKIVFGVLSSLAPIWQLWVFPTLLTSF